MLWFLRFLKGYLRVRFFGDYCEEILNIAARNRITLWDTRLVKRDIECNISLENFSKLHMLLRGKAIRVHILEKKGLPFKTTKYKNRVGIFLGFIIMAAILWALSQRVWIISVTGNKKIPDDKILAICDEVGIKKGIKKNKTEPKRKRQELLLKADGLSWAAINIEGCKLTVNVSETKKKDGVESPCNLNASADGIIKKINVSAGNCLEKNGDTVKRGDVLVSGILELADSTHFVKSIGEIMAETTRSITVEGSFNRQSVNLTGKNKAKSVLEIFGVKIPLYLGKEYREYTSELKAKNLKLFETELPITLYSRKFSFIERQNVTVNEKKLKEELNQKVEDYLKSEGVQEYNVINQSYKQTDEGICLTVIVKAMENIAKPQLIIIEKENP